MPDSHQFHTEIGIFKDTNITVGCTATAFCPQDPVKRMAAFIDRALGLVVRPGELTQKGVPGSRVELLDDDSSFVGTVANALEYRGPSGNVVGGFVDNAVTPGVVGATIAGGGGIGSSANQVSGDGGAVGGGHGNTAGDSATVSGGSSNAAGGNSSTVAGGDLNSASGVFSTVAGGSFNAASGDYSFAAGRRAAADDPGAFVWGGNQSTFVSSPGDNTFNVRASGGIWLGTDSSPSIGFGRFLNTSTGGPTSPARAPGRTTPTAG